MLWFWIHLHHSLHQMQLHPLLPWKVKKSQTLCLMLPMCLQQVLPIWPSLFTMTGRATPLVPLPLSPFLYDFKDPGVWQPNDRQAMKMPDVNKHSGILPSKRTSHSCGQCCLTCHVGWCGLECVGCLMYSGAFHDLRKSCRRRGCGFNHNTETLSIKVWCQNRQLGDVQDFPL